MRCPYCQFPATESTPSCPRCGFSVPGLDKIYGIPPQMASPVADLAGIISRSDIRRIAHAARKFRDHFPQCHIHTATCPIRSPYPVSLFAIWALNRGGLCQGADTGGQNRDILLALDPFNRTAALTLGYGLEPFVGTHHLENAIAAGRNELASGQFGKAVLLMIEALSDALTVVAANLDRTFGIDSASMCEAEIDRGVALPIRHLPGDY